MLYFVRHGATNWNDNINSQGERDPKCQGRADIELNERGIAQAESLAEQFKDKHFARVFCSPLKRARQTCEIICQGKNKIEFEQRIIERDFGEFEGLTASQFDNDGFWDLNGPQKFSKAESLKEVEKRVFDFLDELKNIKGDILVVAHAGVGAIIKTYFCGVPKDGNYMSIIVPNGEPMAFDFLD